MVGRPSGSGFSENANVRAPLAAVRSISSRRADRVPQRDEDERDEPARRGYAHHSSIIQSLYACTHSTASSLSLASQKIWPQKRGNDGK